jgi:hypothetical protein
MTIHDACVADDCAETPTVQHDLFSMSSGVEREIRVAIYDEDNTTLPEYATGLGMAFSNEIDPLATVLKFAGYDVDYLTVHDILDHELLTVNYDVFIMVDNYPRENITNFVNEFHLGGGGVMSINAAFGYLCYDGIIIPEAKGDDAYGLLWDEWTYDDHVQVEKHPITRANPVGYTITEPRSERELLNGNYVKTYSKIGPYFHILANATDEPNLNTVVALENVYRGGRVAAFCTNTSEIQSGIQPLLIDAVDWLCPRPKGRILFDTTHAPTLGVDPWDDFAAANHETLNLGQFRNLLVNHSNSFDKLYPSPAGNLTAENLAPYDMLIIVHPDLNFTVGEVAAVDAWVEAGGGLLVLSDRNYAPEQPEGDHVNFLMSNYDLELNTDLVHGEDTYADPDFHQTTEDCNTLLMNWPKTYINLSGDAQPLWHTDNDVWIGSDLSGDGRLVLAGDMNWVFPSPLSMSDNALFAANLAKWLTAGNVLAYIDSGNMPDPNDLEYRGPAAMALNDLGLKYMLAHNWNYFNLSLHERVWDLVVVDCNYHNPSPYHEELLKYMESGGEMVIRSWSMQYSESYDLWPYLGIHYNGTKFTSESPTWYFWNESHPIFGAPNGFNVTSISCSQESFASDYIVVDLYDNATGIAGLTEEYNPLGNGSAIILSVGGRAIVNGMTLSGYVDDSDDSEYPDSQEVWENEIAYMMRPTIDSPPDDVIEAGTGSTFITWVPESDRPSSFTLTRDTPYSVTTGNWNGSSLAFLVENEPPGIYSYELTVYDTAGHSAIDTVIIEVEDTVDPTISSPSDLEYVVGTTGHNITWQCSDFYPDSYEVWTNTTTGTPAAWPGGSIVIDIDGLDVGTYYYTLTVYDTSGNSVSDTVQVTVTESSSTSTSTTTTTTTGETTDTTSTGPGGEPTDPGVIIIIIIVGGLVVVIVICMLSRRSGTSGG